MLPELLLSASSCICDFFPDSWTIDWGSAGTEQRARKAAKPGISATALPGIMEWATNSLSKEFGWPNAFYSLDAAQTARARFFPERTDLVIFGLGLHESNAAEFLAAAKPTLAGPGVALMGETGVCECVRRRETIAGGGETSGFELLSTYFGLLTCSWLCNGLEKNCADRLGIAPNRRGFVGTYEGAQRCAAFISRPEIKAEPGLWFPWLVTIY